MALAGNLTNKLIAKQLKITHVTLKKYYKKELEAAKEKYCKVAETLIQKALKGDVTAMIFICKTKLGWREVSRTEITGADGKPIEMRKAGAPPIKEMTVEEWRENFQPKPLNLN